MEIFQVADKGLNCARNIYAATKEADDGYIFSKSIHGRNLSEKEKKWLLLENDQNIWKDYRDKDGNLLYRLKSCIDNFSYQFKETDPVTGQDVVKAFSVTEKRIVSYNPALARKQKKQDSENGRQSLQLCYLQGHDKRGIRGFHEIREDHQQR